MSSKRASAAPAQEYVSIKEASILTGIQPQTLRKMGDSGKIACYKTASGQRKFHRASILAMCAGGGGEAPAKTNFIYVRAETRRDVPEKERELEDLVARAPADVEYTRIVDVGVSSDVKRSGLKQIMEACINKTVGTVVVKNKHSIGFFMYDLIEEMVVMAGGKMLMLDEDAAELASLHQAADKPDTVISDLISMLRQI